MENTTKNTELKEGQRFYYTGDMANLSSWGTIISVKKDEFCTSYELEYDDERFDGDDKTGNTFASSFNKGIGQRFKTEEQYNQEMKERQEKFNQIYGRA